MKTLVIAEKPSVARDIARVLGCSKKENGALAGNKYIVTWALGHLVTLKDPEDYDKKYKEWNMAVLPMMPEKLQIKVIPQTGKQYHAVATQLARKDVNEIVIATDAGREGELVARWILDKAHNQKPCKRLWISSVTDKAIREGFANLKDAKEYDNLYRAAVSRAEADWLVGINATRALTCKYNAQLSCGRVQTPTLAMLVERQNQISGFKKEKYFNVVLDFDGLIAEKKKIFDVEEAERMWKTCQGSDAIVEKVESKEKTVKPPKLYDLTTLQREANRIYGMTAQQTLNAAQSLYEQKLITYPRTDSQYLTSDMEETAKHVIRKIHEKYQLLGPFDQPKTPEVKKVLNDKKVSDHHAIIPTVELAEFDFSKLREWEQKILFLIAVHTVEAME